MSAHHAVDVYQGWSVYVSPANTDNMNVLPLRFIEICR